MCFVSPNVPFSVSFLQLPSIIPAIFPACAYLNEYPTSKFIYDSFVKFLFAKFEITAEQQSDFPKWSRKIISDSFKIPHLLFESIQPVILRCQHLKAFCPCNLKNFNQKLPRPVLQLHPQQKKALFLLHLVCDRLCILILPPNLFAAPMEHLAPLLNDSVIPLLPLQQQDWNVIDIITPPLSATFILNILAYCSNNNQCVLLTLPVFSRVHKLTFRRLGEC